MNLSGKIVVLTGSSRGLGAALHRELELRGSIVIGASLSSELTQVDVRREEDVRQLVSGVLSEHGRIDVLINNAGWSPAVKSLEELTETEFGRCMDTNVKGAFNAMKAVLPSMKERNEGIIVNICSRAASRAHPGLTAYSAAKYAQRALTQGLARELAEAGSAVRCLSVSPGGIATDMREELFGSDDRAKQQTPEAVAALIANLLEGNPSVPPGADVHIVKSAITAVLPMDERR